MRRTRAVNTVTGAQKPNQFRAARIRQPTGDLQRATNHPHHAALTFLATRVSAFFSTTGTLTRRRDRERPLAQRRRTQPRLGAGRRHTLTNVSRNWAPRAIYRGCQRRTNAARAEIAGATVGPDGGNIWKTSCITLAVLGVTPHLPRNTTHSPGRLDRVAQRIDHMRTPNGRLQAIGSQNGLQKIQIHLGLQRAHHIERWGAFAPGTNHTSTA